MLFIVGKKMNLNEGRKQVRILLCKQKTII